MQPLPAGITGFNLPTGGEESRKRFASACHVAARALSGRVESFRPAYHRGTPNFHEAIVTSGSSPETIRVLCNAHYPIIAFAGFTGGLTSTQLKFVDCPELFQILSSEFTVLTAQDADSPITPEILSRLNEGELHQIKYWRPQHAGDVIFNYWD